MLKTFAPAIRFSILKLVSVDGELLRTPDTGLVTLSFTHHRASSLVVLKCLWTEKNAGLDSLCPLLIS